jgi:cell division protein FtsI (penicillin-binding protein 3)
MALKKKSESPTQLYLARRYLVLALAVFPLLAALGGFVTQQLKLPTWPAPLAEPLPRGRILARDGTVLAEGAASYRRYPQGQLASHLIGFSGAVQPDGRYGLEGLEYTYDERLQAGEPVVTTLDPTLQAAAERHLREAVIRHEADNGAVVMIEAGTGHVLAAASYPNFDPNLRETRTNAALTNRAFLQQYEPGSVMKPFVVAALLESGRLKPDEVIAAEMTLRVGSKTFRDVAKHESRLQVPDILRYSSNVAMIHLSERFTAEEQHAWLRHFGFGQEVGLNSTFTRTGQLNHWQRWVPQDKASITIGQSVSTTALQLAAAYSIFANDGLYLPPQLVVGEKLTLPKRALSPETALAVRSMLVYTVEESSLRRSKIPFVTVAGKTGTADIFDQASGRYIDGDYTLGFAGIFPAENPRITMVVYLQKPRNGTMSTLVAAPLFRAIGSEVVAHWGLPLNALTYVSQP